MNKFLKNGKWQIKSNTVECSHTYFDSLLLVSFKCVVVLDAVQYDPMWSLWSMWSGLITLISPPDAVLIGARASGLSMSSTEKPDKAFQDGGLGPLCLGAWTY